MQDKQLICINLPKSTGQNIMSKKQFADRWAIILGGSSGFGFAAIEKLSRHGMNIAVLYRETAAAERALKERFGQLAAASETTILPFNINALDGAARVAFIDQFAAVAGRKHGVRLLLHSIARGNLKPLMPVKESGQDDGAVKDTRWPGKRFPGNETLSIEDIQLTSYAMSTSLLDWARDLLKEDLFHPDGRILGLTSEGAHKYWEGYAAVAIAKSSLESLTTYMAVELGKYGLKTNLIRAGITDTPSLNKIPASHKLIELSTSRSPLGRMTKPEDVANVIYLLCTDEASWINGSVIHVDGGEHCL
jgi:enoyl-[acyl-carrier protein] reductase III